MTTIRRCGLVAALLIALIAAAPAAHAHSGSPTLTVTKTGPGTVTDDPLDQINCGTDCSGTYPFTEGEPLEANPATHDHDYQQVTLTAVPASGTTVSWSGACAGAPGTTCTLTVSVNRDVGVTFTDTTNPTVSLTAPANGALRNGTVVVSADASDNVDVQRVDFYRDGIVFASDVTAPYSASLNSTSMADGPHSVGARAHDTAGRASPLVTRNITVDNSAPVVTITDGPANDAHIPAGTTATYTFTATDATAGIDKVECRLQGQPFEDCSSGSKSYSGLAPGTYVFEVRATDNLGHASAATRNLVVDSAPSGGADGGSGPTSAATSTTTTATTTGVPTATSGTAGGPVALAEVLERVGRSFRVTRRGTRLNSLTIEVIDGATVVASCRGRGCAFKRKNARVRYGVANIASLFGRKRMLRPGTRVTVKVTAPDGRVETLAIVVRRRKPPKVTES